MGEVLEVMMRAWNWPMATAMIVATVLLGAVADALAAPAPQNLIKAGDQHANLEEDVGAADLQDSFRLIDHRGNTVKEGDFRGKFLLVAFGYTFCPDVCPTTLQTIALAMDELGAQAEQVQPLFITVDPERDTPEILSEYVAAFHPRILGLSGTVDQVTRAATAYGVDFAKRETGDGYYLMSHSAYIDLMNPDGSYLTSFVYFQSPAEIAKSIRKQIESRGF